MTLKVLLSSMKLNSYLVKSRHGVYYLRVQKNNTDKRFSLHTKDLKIASQYAYFYGASMNFDRNKIIGFELELNENGSIKKVKTDGSQQDNDASIRAIQALTQSHTQNTSSRNVQHSHIINVRDAVEKYKVEIESKSIAKKTKQMTIKALNDLIEIIEPRTPVSELNDEFLEDAWYPARLEHVAQTTARRELTMIKGFTNYLSHRSRKYITHTISFSIPNEINQWKNFEREDLEAIFNDELLTSKNKEYLQILILLYTGARISEVANLQTSDFSEKMGLNLLFIDGTKTNTSVRTIPIHDDLKKAGLLEYVEYCKKQKKENLFKVSKSVNGAGAWLSKFFTAHKKSVGIIDKKKVGHSFRHTLIDVLHNAQVNDKIQEDYVGHAHAKNVHNDHYTKPTPLQLMYDECVRKIDYKKYCNFEPPLQKISEKLELERKVMKM